MRWVLRIRIWFLSRIYKSRLKEVSKLGMNQRVSYLKLREKFRYLYGEMSANYELIYESKLWRENNRELEKVFLPYPPFCFLENYIVARMMFVTRGGEWVRGEIETLEKEFGERDLRMILEEEPVGCPIIQERRYLTSRNSIHNMYHLGRYLERTKVDLEKVKTVVEWGGGYGNFCRLFLKVSRSDATYILVDTPLFAALQWLYLSIVIGERKVNLVKSENERIVKGKVNIIPVHLMRDLEVRCDLFVSTWGLSEGSKKTLEMVVEKKWFGAKHFLIGFQKGISKFPASDGVRREMERKGASFEGVLFPAGSKYAFV